MTLKEKLQLKVSGFKSIQHKSSRFDDVREELSAYGYDNTTELIWNILNDFPEHICPECAKVTSFKSYTDGYKKFCDVKCSNKFKGKDLTIINKISIGLSNTHKNQPRDYWETRASVHRNTVENQPDEYKLEKSKKKSLTAKNVHTNRTPEEKAKLNKKISQAVKYSEKAKQQRIKRAKLGAQALKEYKSLLTEEELKEFNKRYSGRGLDSESKQLFKEYYKYVWYYTRQNCSEVKNIEIRSTQYHLDHKYSIKQGFVDGILPEIIGSKYNLEIITQRENCSKQARCSISKEELLSNF